MCLCLTVSKQIAHKYCFANFKCFTKCLCLELNHKHFEYLLEISIYLHFPPDNSPWIEGLNLAFCGCPAGCSINYEVMRVRESAEEKTDGRTTTLRVNDEWSQCSVLQPAVWMSRLQAFFPWGQNCY